MKYEQTGILSDLPTVARFLTFSLADPADLAGCLTELAEEADGDSTVVGIGESVAQAMGATIPGLRTFPACTGPGIEVPSTPAALWCWLRGDDRGEVFHRARHLELLLAPTFILDEAIDSFTFEHNRDLTGYVDGTENPTGEAASATAIVSGQGPGYDGGSFVAVQQWLHDFDVFWSMTSEEQDNTIGRSRVENEELADAPPSAHIRRTAQEAFDPEAFIVRRSMPWTEGAEGGLMFVAFGRSFDAYETLLNNMLGKNDGITDALFNITRPVSGAYFWCPPMKDEWLDLSALGL